MDIYELVNKYIEAGYSEDDAIPKVAQDIVLLKIGNSKYRKNITVKGGVVMHNISKDMRRATRDNENLNKDKLLKYIDILIFQDENMRENSLEDVNRRLSSILNNSRFQSRINTANNNWLEIPIKDVIDSVLEYFGGLIKVAT